MSCVLIYNISGAKAAGIKLLCSQLHIDYKVVQPEEYGRKLACLLGLAQDDTIAPDSGFDDEMLYLADLGGMLNIFLSQLRRRKLTVTLKAVKTDTNLGFTSCELYREIAAEHEAIRQGRTDTNFK